MRAENSIIRSAIQIARAAFWSWPMLAMLGALLSTLVAQAQPTEHQLKAAVLGNVAKFVEWPEPKNEQPISIGILGHDPFGNDLEVVLKNVKVKGRNIAIKRSGEIKDLEDCHIIFFSARETSRMHDVRQRLRNRPVLTVGEEARFLEEGGAVSLETEQRKIQISINLPAAEEARVTVNAQLLALAKTVKRKEQP
jgi:hypothetical protein